MVNSSPQKAAPNGEYSSFDLARSNGVSEDPLVIEGELQFAVQDAADRVPRGVLGVAPGGQDGEVGCEQKVGHREHIPARVAPLWTVGPQLFQVARDLLDAGFLSEFTARCRRQILAGQHETARQGKPAAEGLDEAGDEQDIQDVLRHSQGDDVDRHREAGRRRAGFRHEPIVGNYRHLDNISG